MRVTKKQKAAATRLVELAAEAERLLMDIGPINDSSFIIANHAVETLMERAERLRVATLTRAEYQAELEGTK